MVELPRATRLGRYEILAPIAAGGMAEVFAARVVGESPPKLVAIKVMREELLAEERFVAMFVDEASVAAHITHPNVVGMHDLGRNDQGVPYLVMDLVIGASVSQLLKGEAPLEPAPLPVAIAIEIAAQVAEGLHAAHEAKDALGTPLEVVHRDVSPQNILVGLDGRVRITDFGVARAVARLTRTESGEVKGKARYFAPEQALAKGVDRRADLWALGVVLWETLSLKPLFSGRTMGDVLKAVASQPIPDVREHRAEVPASLVGVIAQVLERDLDARLATGKALAEALRAAARRAALPTPSPAEVARFVRERSGLSIEGLTDAIHARTGVPVHVPLFEAPAPPNVGAPDDGGFGEDEPTTVDRELVKEMARTKSRPGMYTVVPGGAPAAPAVARDDFSTMPESQPTPELARAMAQASSLATGQPLEKPRGGVATLPLGVMLPSENELGERGPRHDAQPMAVVTAPASDATARCPRCGRDVPMSFLAFAEDGARVCKSCHSAEVIAEGDEGAVRSIAGMGYGALLSGLLTLCMTWVPYLNFVPAVLAIGGATAFFVNVSRSPEHRRRMGWQLPAATIAAAVGLALGLLVPITYLLVIAGLAAAR